MPLDYTPNELLPENINFPVEFEPTKFDKSKYVINGNTGEYLGIVGNGFSCASHSDFFTRAHNTISEHLGVEFCDNMNIKYRTARNNAWVMMDMTMPNVLRKIVTDKHSTTIAPRLIALHGIDGSCSNMVFFGAIDFFCTNGMVSGDYDKIKRKNTANFNLDVFIDELNSSVSDFYETADKFQRWANTSLMTVDVKALLESVIKSDRKSEKMFSLYNQEVSTRGRNVWALYSAFTNYASYADERNGFNLRNTGNDTAAQSMWSREQEVSKWISTPQFKAIAA
jgi:hypothetical protein|tara:strand:- start:862 stop:1707 length:846 start_codon:yes stop_codon:yes gene_type:complete